MPPQDSGAKISRTDESKQIELLAKTPERASAPNASRAQCRSDTVLRCSMAAPFGRPVDPDV